MLGGGFRLAGFQQGLAFGDEIRGGGGGAGEFEQGFDEAFDFAFRQRALKRVGDLALPEGNDGGDGLQRQAHLAELLDEGAVLVHVDFHQLDAAAGGADGFFQGGREGFAGTAPGGPEIHDDGQGFGGGDDVGHEGGLVAIDD